MALVDSQGLEPCSSRCKREIIPRILAARVHPSFFIAGATVTELVENIGLEPIKLGSCKDPLGALPIPRIRASKVTDAPALTFYVTMLPIRYDLECCGHYASGASEGNRTLLILADNELVSQRPTLACLALLTSWLARLLSNRQVGCSNRTKSKVGAPSRDRTVFSSLVKAAPVQQLERKSGSGIR